MSFATDTKSARAGLKLIKAGRKRGEPPKFPTDLPSFCARYITHPISPAWRALLATIVGLAIVDAAERDAFARFASFEAPTSAHDGYSEVLVVAGRRGAKTETAAAIGVYECIVRGAEHMRALAPGQRGHFCIISKTNRQGLECFRYARGIIESNPELAEMLDGEPLESMSGGELRFKSGTVLTVMPASKSSVRGFTIIGCILDEAAWFATDEEAANADEEIASAVRFAMLPPKGAPQRRLIIISSPAAKRGLVYDLFTEHHGKAEAPVLAVRGSTRDWNPSVDEEWLALEQARDPKRYRREILAEFVDAISAWCEANVIELSTIDRTAQPLKPIVVPVHWPDGQGPTYYGAVDIAFRRDASVLAIGHLDGTGKQQEKRFIVDGVWRWVPTTGEPLNMASVVAAMAQLCKEYGVPELVGDQFASVPLGEAFALHGIKFNELTATQTSKMEIFTALRERFYASRVSLPNDEVVLRELKELQERITSSGGVQIGHPNRATAHDDTAHAIAWLHADAAKPRPFVGSFTVDWMSFQ